MMRIRLRRLFVIVAALSMATARAATPDPAGQGALDGVRHRVIVSTDIGGTDYDDFQSLVHLLLYADVLDLEGLISSPYGPGSKEHLLEVIERYEQDYPNLRTHSARYPSPAALRALVKQGETEVAPYAGVRNATEGSDWIIRCARRDDPRPLHVLVWGGLEDLAQALHDAPEIRPRLRVHFVGGPNKKWSPDAYQYLVTHHPQLWMIESNATYAGWFAGGDQEGDLGAASFVESHVRGRGALGDYFAGGIAFGGTTRTSVKMGDSPTLGWLLRGDPDKPFQPGWGGRFVRAWKRPYHRFDRLTTDEDRMETYGVLELVLPVGEPSQGQPALHMEVENQRLLGHFPGDGTVRFRFSPKGAQTYRYTLRGNLPGLDGREGAIVAMQPAPDVALRPDPSLPNWWTDDPSPSVAEGRVPGAKTVNQWRAAYLHDFAARLNRCAAPAGPGAPSADGESRHVYLDIEYGEAGGEKLLLDVTIPEGEGPFPLAIYVHGGGWTGGDKANPADAPALDLLARAGFVSFSINYRLAPAHRWPACLDDVAAAVRWVKANASRFRGDSGRIVLSGYSAGGHLASFAATLVDESVRVDAVVAFAPLTDFVQELPMRGNILGRAQRGLLNRPEELTPEARALLAALSPVNHLRPGLPPFLLLHGDHDRSVPFEQSLAFRAKLNDMGVRCDLIAIPGGTHRLTDWTSSLPDYPDQAIAWLREIMPAR